MLNELKNSPLTLGDLQDALTAKDGEIKALREALNTATLAFDVGPYRISKILNLGHPAYPGWRIKASDEVACRPTASEAFDHARELLAKEEAGG